MKLVWPMLQRAHLTIGEKKPGGTQLMLYLLAKAKELNVDEVLYMNVQKNKYAYIVRDSRGVMLYTDERNLYTKLYKGLKVTYLQE